jgi:hypothetical protein
MNKLLQYLINETNVEGRVMPGLQKVQRGGQYASGRDATSVNTTAANKMFGVQRNIDADKLSEDSFKEKYKMTPHQYRMRTDPGYAQSFQRQMDQIRQNDPNYSEINLPATDVRSKNYRGNPNLALIPKGSTGPARASQEQLFADMTSMAAPLLPVKSLVRGLQAAKAASAAPKIVDRVASVPSSIRTALNESVDNSGLIINEDVYRQWANARRKANIPESRSAIRSSSPPPPQSMQAWGTGNWDGSTIIPADNIQPYRPVWPGTQLRNSTISPLNLSSFVENRADRLIGATRKIDEKLGKLFSKTTNAPAFDPDEVTRLINENLSKGVGVKKENLGLQVRNSPLPYDLETGFRIETLIDNNKVGSILFQRNMNPYKPKKFSQILLDKLPTPFDRWRNTPGFKKTNDFPFQDYDPINPIKDPTGKTFNTANDLYTTGISGEFNKAVNEAFKAKGLGNVLSGGTGHSTLGAARWKKLVERGLAEDLGDGYYKLKKEGGPVILPKMQMKGEVKDATNLAASNKIAQLQLLENPEYQYKKYLESLPQLRQAPGFGKKALRAADVATDVMQMGNFIPNPIAQTIAKVGNVAGTAIDAYQAAADVYGGDYTSAGFNAASAMLPSVLGANTFKRNSKYLQPGQPLYPLSPQARGSFDRVKYIEPFTKVKGMTDKSLMANRALLGTLGAETAYDADLIGPVKKEYGGPILDPRGQWAHPGKVTRIPSPNITMQGVPYPVLGVGSNGQEQMMYPGQDYNFGGASYVDEYPMMKNGGGLLSKSVTCSNCGHSWKGVEGGIDPLNCHKCGGLVKMKKGGQHGGLDRWFAEKWVDVKTGKDCGRQEGEKRAGYPACRPSKRVSSKTPKTSSEMSSAEKAKFKASKTSSQRIDYNHKRNK